MKPGPEKYRITVGEFASRPGDTFGVFIIPTQCSNWGRGLKIIACDGADTGWEHVSVSVKLRTEKCPSWDEMCFVKSLFWEDDECVVQFHPPKKDYVNVHPGVLHLWKCVNQPFPMPPRECV